MLEEVVKCDVLCAGGGIAGLMAAVRARELGANVIIAEKGNVNYSGCGRCGNDHFETYIPEVHGEDKIIVFNAKAVVLGTGKCSKLYPGLTPGWMFNDPHGGVQTGDGRAMAYRAGAELQNVEMPQRHIGPKYFTKFGQATWVGVLKDPQGKPVGTFAAKPDRKYGDMIMEVNKLVAEEYTQSGKGPLYMDCTGMTDVCMNALLVQSA